MNWALELSDHAGQRHRSVLAAERKSQCVDTDKGDREKPTFSGVFPLEKVAAGRERMGWGVK